MKFEKRKVSKKGKQGRITVRDFKHGEEVYVLPAKALNLSFDRRFRKNAKR